jgi:hypothetical protein
MYEDPKIDNVAVILGQTANATCWLSLGTPVNGAMVCRFGFVLLVLDLVCVVGVAARTDRETRR